ncbi:outer membrane protein assembly factor BamE [Dyadobacter sp. NIV53]|uniref:outer membrane protein assembly factor BamE n=1 Tax=Dyadobacter sp. NIV53 TaxID=2861765 RepID=UPI001C86866C|nr:outer membrane protein assembly factor BamE [Dyadobacter sp. NIV53]
MKLNKMLLSLLAIYCLNGCVSNNIAWKTNENIKKIKIGMTKEEVIKTLGQKYMITSSARDAYGNPVEVIGYKSDMGEEYHLKFITNKLTEWNRQHINKNVVKDHLPSD